VVEQSRSRLQDVEIRPFRRAIAAKVGRIMMATSSTRARSPVSGVDLQAIVDGILRRELEYDGWLLTDDSR